MVLPEPYFTLSDSRDTSCAIRFVSEPVPQLRDSWDNTWCYRKPRRYSTFSMLRLNPEFHSSILSHEIWVHEEPIEPMNESEVMNEIFMSILDCLNF